MPEKMQAKALQSPSDLTAEWLAAALERPIKAIDTKVLGVGESSMNVRASFLNENGQEETVVVKLPSDKQLSRQHAIDNGYYEHEVMFYREFSGKLPTVPVAYKTILDQDGTFTIIMQDFPGCTQIDNIDRISAKGAEVILSTLAETQGSMLGDWMWAGQIKWLKDGAMFNAAFAKKQYPAFRAKFSKRLSEDQFKVLDWFISVAEDWEKAVIPPLGLCHNDFRLDNILFTKEQGCVIIDWATCTWGPAFRDVAYFMGTCLSTEEWKKNGRALFEHYVSELDANSEIAVKRDASWRAFCSQTLHALNYLIGCLAALDLSERAVELAGSFMDTTIALVVDVDAKTIVEQDIEKASKILEPAPEDDDLHPIAPGFRYNESWYYDVHTGDETVYIRYGRLPHQNKALLYLVIMKEGHPLYQIELEDAKLPEADNKLAEFTHERAWFKHDIIKPLKEVRVQIKGKAHAYKNHTAPLWHHAAEPDLVDVELDITWKNVGKAMLWRITPRWECPADAKGVLKIAGKEYLIEGPGQRDHSWGMRDWWKVNGNWGNLHFEDGTRIQFLGEWEYQTFCQGYTQNLRDGSMVEHTYTNVESDWEINARLKRATIYLQPGDQEIYVKPLRQGGHRLLGTEGRCTVWPRISVEVETKEGVKGVGLVEAFFVENRGPEAPRKFGKKKQIATN